MLGRQNRSLDVDVEDPLPVRFIAIHDRHAGAQRARRVDQCVNGTKALPGGIGRRRQIVPLRHIDAHRQYLVPGLAAHRLGFAQSGHIEVEHHDVGPGLGHQNGRFPPQAGRRPGDNARLACEVGHSLLLLIRWIRPLQPGNYTGDSCRELCRGSSCAGCKMMQLNRLCVDRSENVR